MRRQPLSIRDALLLTIGGLTLLITLLVIHKTYESWEKLQKAQELKQLTLLDTQIYQLVGKLSEERGVTYLMLLSPRQEFIRQQQAKLPRIREQEKRLADDVIQKLKSWSATDGSGLYQQVEKMGGTVEEWRRRTDAAAFHSTTAENQALAEQWFLESTQMMETLQDSTLALYESFSGLDLPTLRHLRFNHLLSLINEYAGRERTFNGGLIISGVAPSGEQQSKQWRWQGTIDLSWKIAETLMDEEDIRVYFNDARSHYYASFDMMHNVVQPLPNGEVTYLISEDLWLQLAADALQSLSDLGEKSLQNTLQFTEQTEKNAQQEILYHILLLGFALGLCLYSFYVITSRVLNPVHRMVEALYAVMQGKPVDMRLAAVRRNDEIGKLAVVLVDYQASSERIKRASAELQRHVRALERSNKELDDFAYIASHDLKEPLRGIHNHSRFLLEDNEDKLDEDSVNRLHRLTYLTQRMEKLINDLLYFSRLGRQDMAVQDTDLNAVITDIESTLEHLLEERNGRIVLPRPLPVITCDQTRVAEVFRNLITNALKYNDSAEKTVEIGYRDSAVNADGIALRNVLYVKDNGIGIPAEFRTEVFRIFRRLHATKGAEEGTGVGLTFVKKIIDRHGGTIWLESEPDAGTTFYFTLERTEQ